MQMVLKWADIGHLAGSWDVHQKWLERLEEELFRYVNMRLVQYT
jgi:hypothetical protein